MLAKSVREKQGVDCKIVALPAVIQSKSVAKKVVESRRMRKSATEKRGEKMG